MGAKSAFTGILLIVILFFHLSPVFAESEVFFTVEFNSPTGYYPDGNKYLVIPLGIFNMNYTVTNETEHSLNIKIEEELKDNTGKIIDTYTGEYSVAPKQTDGGEHVASLKGKDYKAFPEGAPYTLVYRLYKITENGQQEELGAGSTNVDVAKTHIKLKYSVRHPEIVFKEQAVEYIAEIESESNVELYNVNVKDSVFGLLGVIPVLKPGQKEVFTKTFYLEETTESYAEVTFTDPFEIDRNVRSAEVRVEVSQDEPVASLEVSGSVDKKYIIRQEDVTFTLVLKNSGNVMLVNLKCVDWNGKVFFTKDSLSPGEEISTKYTAEVIPDNSYQIICTGTVEGTNQKIQYVHKFDVYKLDPRVEVKRRIQPEKIKAGEKVTFTYVIANVGNVSLVNVILKEPEFGEIANFEILKPGEEREITIERILKKNTVSKPVVIAKENKTGTEYRYEAEERLIPVNVLAGKPDITFRLQVYPPVLETSGDVELICLIKNKGNGSIKNVEVFVPERNMTVGSFMCIEAGKEKVVKVTSLGVKHTESFSIAIRGEDESGASVEFRSEPVEVRVESRERLLEKSKSSDSFCADSKLKLLRNILIVIVILIIFTGGALIYFTRKR